MLSKLVDLLFNQMCRYIIKFGSIYFPIQSPIHHTVLRLAQLRQWWAKETPLDKLFSPGKEVRIYLCERDPDISCTDKIGMQYA